jgi:hypothetical protein
LQGSVGATGPTGPLPTGAKNLVLATPTGASGVSSLRALVVSDMPIAVQESIVPYQYTPQGYEQITNLTTAVGFSSIPGAAKYAFVTVSGANVRYRDDGTAPTSSLGMPVPVGSQLQYSGTLSAIEFIQESTGAVLDIAFYS